MERFGGSRDSQGAVLASVSSTHAQFGRVCAVAVSTLLTALYPHRMKRELAELNALYQRAMQSARLLADLSAQGLLDGDSLQQLRAVEGSALMASIAAMDAITAIDPLRAVTTAQPE